MRCEDFFERMNEVLDTHQNPAADPELAEHASHCDACDQLLHHWHDIELAMVAASPAVTRAAPRASWMPVALAASLAAMVLFGVTGDPAIDPGDSSADDGPAVVQAGVPELDLHALTVTLGQPRWWKSVMEAAWEPVDPLARSFRPLTDSVATALDALTPLSRPAPAIDSPILGSTSYFAPLAPGPPGERGWG